jgi:hypothetical protein
MLNGHPQKNVGAALIKLARKLAVGDIELKETMTGRQGHIGNIDRVPGRHNEPAGMWIALYLHDDIRNLVDGLAIGAWPRSPLMAVNRAKVAIFIGPFIPNPHPMITQVANVGITGQKPQQFMDNRF